MRLSTLLLLMSIICASCTKKDIKQPENEITLPIIANSISNQQIRAFAEDKNGHIWIGTFRGLNKFTSHEYHQYFCTNNSSGLPDNQIQDLLCDSKGRLWVSTVNGVCIYTDEDKFQRIPMNAGNKIGLKLLETKDGEILLYTGSDLHKYNPDSNQMDCIIKDIHLKNTFSAQLFVDSNNNLWSAGPLALISYDIKDMTLKKNIPLKGFPTYFYLHSNGDLWLTGNRTIQIFNVYTYKFIDLPTTIKQSKLWNNNIEYIHPYGDNYLLLKTPHDGIFCYNYHDNSVIHEKEKHLPISLPKIDIWRMFTDSQKNLWIGSYDQGYEVAYNYKRNFNSNNNLQTYMKNKSVFSVAMGKDNSLWMLTLRDGLYRYDFERQEIQKINLNQFLTEEKKEQTLANQVFVDTDNNIWIVTPHNETWLCSYEQNKLQIKKRFNIPMGMSITQDQDKTIWIGSASPLVYCIDTNLEMKSINILDSNNKFTYTFIPGITPLHNNKIMVSAFALPIKLIDKNNHAIEDIPISQEDYKNCIRRSVIIPTAIHEDSRHDIWIGTVSNGLLRYSSANKKLEPVPGTACTDISAIEEDEQGNLWISTLYGLSKYDRTTQKMINYYEADGIGGNQFYDRASCKLPDGTLVFGGTHGITFFNPIDIQSRQNVPLMFESLKVHNQLIHPGAGQCIEKHLSQNPEIRLRHDQNGFSISFTALDYSEFERIRYHYTLEGFDKYWIDAYNNREAYYANLPTGKYLFKVKATNHDQSVVMGENAITVIIEPAPWATWWAYLIYMVVATVIIGLLVRARMRIQAEKMALKRAEYEEEQEQRINRMNMSFFANISHEFRTPLTMIAGPVTQLCDSNEITGQNKSLLHIVQRSVDRMLRLVNQMMDFNKLENDTLKLKVKHADIISLLQKQTDIFRVNAQSKNITLTTCGLEDSFLTWLDTDKVDKIFNNLMSNALKYTPRGGSIRIDFDLITRTQAGLCFTLTNHDRDSQYIKISVSNTGSSIPEDKLEKIFERYYQLSNPQEGTYNWGTGIGLYYARNLVRMHHGHLKAENLPDNEGVIFTFILPVSDVSYSVEEQQSDTLDQQSAFPLPMPLVQEKTVEIAEDNNLKTILVVDDDTEVAHYLSTLLSAQYRVVCRFDADNALTTIREEAPDLILSDVVMPNKDGYQLCKEIKDDLQLCHIPVILVTAKATVDNQVQGLNIGADAYVTKPFDPNYLLALISSQLKNRDKVRNLLGKATQTDNIEENMLSPQDNAFMTELYQLMEKELSNPELDISHMTELMHISRTKFYYKVKGLTGENPSVFFKTYKLNRAAELIIEGKYTFAEIADMTGFATPSHFSKSFKKQFGVTPSSYKTVAKGN